MSASFDAPSSSPTVPVVPPSSSPVHPKVYILSRLVGLLESVESVKGKLCPELLVKRIDLPDENDYLSEDEGELKDIEVLLADPQLLASNYSRFPKLKWVHSTWAGVEQVFDTIKEKPGFILTKHTDVDFCEMMADFVMAHVLISEKNLFSVYDGGKKKSWSTMYFQARQAKNRRIRELTVVVLGVGNMGMAVAKYFKVHGANLIGFARRTREINEYFFFDRIEYSLEKVLPVADYIVNTLPSTPETTGLLNGFTLKVCTKKPIFINVGRGTIIGQSSLIEALEHGWISHAILDVFEKEPLPPESQLWAMTEKITISPHCAAMSHPRNVARDFVTHFMMYQQKIDFPTKIVVNRDLKY